MRFLALLLAFIPAVASAEPPCWPKLPPKATTVTVAAPALGTIVYQVSTVGMVFGWACMDASGTWWKVTAGGPWANFAPDWLWQADKAMRGTDADRQALWNKYAGTMDSRLQPMVDAVKAVLPNPPVWKVAPNSTYPTRPTYAWANGVRDTKAATERVDVGAVCDPAVGVVTASGTGSYLGVLGRSDRVALCRKQ